MARKSPADRAVDAGAQALTTAALIQKVAQETAERVATETAARVSQQYDAAISELTASLDKATKRALTSVRAVADAAEPASSKQALPKKSGKKQTSEKKADKSKSDKKGKKGKKK